MLLCCLLAFIDHSIPLLPIAEPRLQSYDLVQLLIANPLHGMLLIAMHLHVLAVLGAEWVLPAVEPSTTDTAVCGASPSGCSAMLL